MSRRAIFLERGDLPASGFDGTFQPIGAPLEKIGVMVKLVNNSSVGVEVSIDGVTNHDFVRAGSDAVWNFRTNHGVDNHFEIAKNTQFFVKGTAGTGEVYLTVVSEV